MSRSRVSRIDLPLSRLSSTASRRACFCTARASAYRWRARAWPDSADQAGKVLRAAATAASTSALPACVTRASGVVVAGLMTSNASPFLPLVQRPPTNRPNARPCRSSHSSAGLSLWGAVPYAIVSKISETVVMSYHWMTVRRGVPPRDEMFELPLDVGEQRRGAEPEQVVAQPAIAQLLFHEDEPVERLLRLADPARRLDTDGVAGALVVIADLPRHHHADREGGVHRLLARGRLDEVRARHHRHLAGARHVRERREVAGAEDHLHVRLAARVPKGANLGVQRLPVSGERMGSGDDYVDLAGARGHGRFDLVQPLGQRIKAGGKAGRHRGDGDVGALEGCDGCRDERGIHALRAHLDLQGGGAERRAQVVTHGPGC